MPPPCPPAGDPSFSLAPCLAYSPTKHSESHMPSAQAQRPSYDYVPNREQARHSLSVQTDHDEYEIM